MPQSWSKIRKRLEQDYLCDALQGRIQYFFTIYHNSHDGEGRFAVRVDGKEVWNAHSFNEGTYDRIAKSIKISDNIPSREWDGKNMIHDEENLAAESKAVQIANEWGIASTWDVMWAIELYLNMDIHEALQLDNPIIKMFAILDRRVGKRTLERVRDSYCNGPAWLKQFYALRIEAER